MAARAAGEEDRPGEKLRKVGEGRVENIGKISSQVMSFRLRFPSHPRPNASRYYYFLCRGSRFFLDIWASLPAKTMFRVRAAGDPLPLPLFLVLPFSGVVSLSAQKNALSWKATFEKLSFLLLPASTIFTLTFGDVTRMFIDHIAINPNSGRGWVPRVTAQGGPFFGDALKDLNEKGTFFVATKLQRQREIKKYVNEWKSFVRKGENTF